VLVVYQDGEFVSPILATKNSGAEHGHELVADPLKAVVPAFGPCASLIFPKPSRSRKISATNRRADWPHQNVCQRSRSPICWGGPSNYRFVSRYTRVGAHLWCPAALEGSGTSVSACAATASIPLVGPDASGAASVAWLFIISSMYADHLMHASMQYAGASSVGAGSSCESARGPKLPGNCATLLGVP